MGKFSTVLGSLLVAALLVASAGCNKNRDDDYYEQRSTVAQTPKPYPVSEAGGVKYAVLAKGSVVASNINGWKALNPEFFTKLSGIAVTAPAEDTMYHPGVGYVIPKIEASAKFPDRKMTAISSGYLVPKELHGWVAIDNETFAKLAEKFMTGDTSKPAPNTAAQPVTK